MLTNPLVYVPGPQRTSLEDHYDRMRRYFDQAHGTLDPEDDIELDCD